MGSVSPDKNNPGYPGLFLFFVCCFYYCGLFCRQHTLNGIHYRLGLRINFDIHTMTQFFRPQRGALESFRN